MCVCAPYPPALVLYESGLIALQYLWVNSTGLQSGYQEVWVKSQAKLIS